MNIHNSDVAMASLTSNNDPLHWQWLCLSPWLLMFIFNQLQLQRVKDARKLNGNTMGGLRLCFQNWKAKEKLIWKTDTKCEVTQDASICRSKIKISAFLSSQQLQSYLVQFHIYSLCNDSWRNAGYISGEVKERATFRVETILQTPTFCPGIPFINFSTSLSTTSFKKVLQTSKVHWPNICSLVQVP